MIRQKTKTAGDFMHHCRTLRNNRQTHAGTLTVEEYAAFARVIESREALAAEFQKMTKDAIMKPRSSGHYKNDGRKTGSSKPPRMKRLCLRHSGVKHWVIGTDRLPVCNLLKATQADLDAYAVCKGKAEDRRIRRWSTGNARRDRQPT